VGQSGGAEHQRHIRHGIVSILFCQEQGHLFIFDSCCIEKRQWLKPNLANQNSYGSPAQQQNRFNNLQPVVAIMPPKLRMPASADNHHNS